MAYIGFNPSQLAVAPFATKLFAGDGTTTTFTLDQSVPGANEANVEVVVENVIQNPIDAYTISGSLNNQLVFSEAPASGAAIYVIHKGEATYNLQPSTGSVTAATLDPVLRNFTVNTFAGTGSATTFTLTDTPYSANSILVTVDGITQTAGTNYTVSGTTLDFGATAPDNGSVITVVHLGFSSGNKSVMDGSITPVKLSTGAPSWNTSGTMFIGTSTALGGATNPIVAMYASANNYVQTYVLNRNSGSGASADLVAYPDNGTDGSGWIDMGITSSTFSSTPYGITGANEGYLFMSAPSGASKSGNLVIATDSTGTANAIVFATNGFTSGTEKMRITSAGHVGIGSTPKLQTSGVVAGVKTLTVFDSAQGGGGLELMTASTTNTAGVGRIIFGTTGNTDGSRAIAWIDSLIQGTTANNQGGMMRFATKADNGSTSTVMSLLSNGIVDLPYGQIKFPAAQNASSDANTLDDYEEGTWNPIITGSVSNPTVTYTAQRGKYTKVGNLVHCQIDLRWSALSGGSGSAYLTLPFVSSNDQYSGGVIAEKNSGWALSTNYTYMTWENNVGTSYLILLQNGNGVATAGMSLGTNVPTGTAYLIGTFTYTV